MGLPGFEPGSVDSESTVLAITPQAHKSLRRPGIEPGPRAWKARILTIELSTLWSVLTNYAAPTAGIEPATTWLRVMRSTIWAKRADVLMFPRKYRNNRNTATLNSSKGIRPRKLFEYVHFSRAWDSMLRQKNECTRCSISDGIRTRNLSLRRGMRYPLRHRDT